VRVPRNVSNSAAQTATDASDVPEIATDTNATDSAQTALAGQVAATSGSSRWWWGAAIVLAALASGALVAARYFGRGEWNIVEEKGG